mmetsp:Transcript_19226/g.66271  ORF Transcript_19226/g.66271 Transcript_19226/m.66271 type:complete len:282 (+) Transcript_19226:265-1110(+)
MLPEDVGLLLAVELTLPLFEAEARVVLHAGHEHVAAGDGVVDGQPRGVPHGVGVGGQLGALHEDGAEVRVRLDDLHRLCDDARLHLCDVDLPPQLDGVEAVDFLAADDDERLVLGVKVTFGPKRLEHVVQVPAVGREDGDTLAVGEAGSHSRELHQGRHEHGQLCEVANQRLDLHHETAVAGDAAAALGLEPLGGGLELDLDVLRQLVGLAHVKGVARHASVVDAVVPAQERVDVTRRRGIVVVKEQDAQCRSRDGYGLARNPRVGIDAFARFGRPVDPRV